MKLSEYLWKRTQLDAVLPDEVSPEQITGEINAMLNGDVIVSDIDGKEISVRDANSVYGRNYEELNAAYKANNKALFNLICQKQQASDAEWEQLKHSTREA